MASRDLDQFESFSTAFAHMLGAMRRARSRTSREVAGGELTFSQFQLLAALDQGPRSVGDLAEDAGVKSPTITRMLDNLEQLDIIERKPAAADRRSLSICVTPKGRALLERKQERYDRLTESIFESLSDSERRRIAPLLDRISAAIEAL